MTVKLQKCTYCGKTFFRSFRRMNENEKFKWKTYCSNKCMGLSKRNAKTFSCSNPLCRNIFLRNPSDLSKSKCYFCSLRCAAIVNNQKYPKNHCKIIKICKYCQKQFFGREKYCSRKCKNLGESIPAKDLINDIKDFVKKNGRIPFKQEFNHSHAARLRFGTWNNAVKLAGFDPNPIMFSKKYIANDGDKCDSLAEKIIDDYLFAKNIKHIRNFPYPGNKKFTVDFKIGDCWVEFFGLSGQLKKYDELMAQKLRLVKEYKLRLIKLYLSDLFPENKLPKKLAFVK